MYFASILFCFGALHQNSGDPFHAMRSSNDSVQTDDTKFSNTAFYCSSWLRINHFFRFAACIKCKFECKHNYSSKHGIVRLALNIGPSQQWPHSLYYGFSSLVGLLMLRMEGGVNIRIHNTKNVVIVDRALSLNLASLSHVFILFDNFEDK
ncbi:hypothetical protein SUGI_0187530 [Cryptomeria japonica]|nr:hypothetical protein SUGI_0187530 [Cryptomeria japonica]